MEEKKHWYTSKTFWGIIISVVSAILKQHNIDIPLIGDPTGTEAIGAGLAAWGLRTAKHPIGM